MEKTNLINRTEREEKLERLVVIDDSESQRMAGRTTGTLVLDGLEARVELQFGGDCMRIRAECAGLVIDGFYNYVMRTLGNPVRSRFSDLVRALAVRTMGMVMDSERMDRAAAAIRTYTLRWDGIDQHYNRLSDALRASAGLYDSSLECSKGCTLDAHMTRLLRAGWQALGAGEDYCLETGIRECRMDYSLVCRLMPHLDDLEAFINGVA